MTDAEFDPRLVYLSPEDNICVVAQRLAAGERVRVAGAEVAVAETLPIGHKIAVRAIAAGETVLKYGAPIGSATSAIAVGDHVHVHNLQSDYILTYDREGEGAFKG
jgi:altronate dehydratase